MFTIWTSFFTKGNIYDNSLFDNSEDEIKYMMSYTTLLQTIKELENDYKRPKAEPLNIYSNVLSITNVSYILEN